MENTENEAELYVKIEVPGKEPVIVARGVSGNEIQRILSGAEPGDKVKLTLVLMIPQEFNSLPNFKDTDDE